MSIIDTHSPCRWSYFAPASPRTALQYCEHVLLGPSLGPVRGAGLERRGYHPKKRTRPIYAEVHPAKTSRISKTPNAIQARMRWCHSQGGVTIRVVSQSRWCHSQGVITVDWCHSQGEVTVKVVSQSRWCHCTPDFAAQHS